MSRVLVLTMKFPCVQELPPTEPVEQGDEGGWDTVGEATGSRSPAPTIEELLAQMERQPPAAQESTELAAAAAEEATEGVAATESYLIDNRLVYFAGNRRICPGRGMNPPQRWRKRKSRRPLGSPLPPLRRSPKRRSPRLRCQ
jgi:hypothetical protein